MSNIIMKNSLDKIAKLRLGSRKQLTSNIKLDQVHRDMIFEEDVLYNPMYHSLLDDNFSNDQIQLFYSEYYYGSIRGFLREVMPLTLKCYDDKNWIGYISAIRKEETRPKSHIILFEEFLESAHLVLLQRKAPSIEFIEKSKIGYTKNLPYSCGYALAVEMEADYQIYIVGEFTKKFFGDKFVHENTWFNVHLDVTGEEEHANMTINLAETCIKSEIDFDEFVAGFKQSCKDTELYMVNVHKLLQNIKSKF